MKTCTICKVRKSLDQFNKNARRRDGLQSHCRACSKSRSSKYYQDNREKHLTVISKRKRETVEENKQLLLDWMNGRTCADCDESDVIVLEFDHVRGQKKRNISYMVAKGYSWKTILSEIAKCEIRCANCHRRRTSSSFGWLRSLQSNPAT